MDRLLNSTLTALALLLPISIAGTNIALGLVTAALVAGLARGRPLDWHRAWNPVAWWLCLYCGAAVLAAALGESPAVSVHNLHKDFHKLWVFLVLLLAWRACPARQLPAALAASFVFVATFAITQSILDTYHNHILYHDFTWMRVRAFVHPVTCGEILALGLLGGLSFLARPEAGPKDRRPTILLLVLMGIALLLNQTRAAFLGLMAGFAAMCLANRDLRRWLKWAGLAALLGMIILELLPTGRSITASLMNMWAASGTLRSNAQMDRLVLWDVAWRIFKDHPWLGVGPANYATVFTRYCDGIVGHQRVWSSAHNLLLHQLAERGLVGLAALLGLGWALLGRAWQRARRVPDAWNLWALGATVGFYFMNLTETAFQNELVTAFFLWIWTRSEADV